MNTETYEELKQKINDLIEKADAPVFETAEEIQAVITLFSSRLNDEKRPMFENDRALLGKIAGWLDHSFGEFLHTVKTPEPFQSEDA